MLPPPSPAPSKPPVRRLTRDERRDILLMQDLGYTYAHKLVREAWDTVGSEEELQKLTRKMLERCQAVIDVDVNHIPF
jgi:hypothetical protein